LTAERLDKTFGKPLASMFHLDTEMSEPDLPTLSLVVEQVAATAPILESHDDLPASSTVEESAVRIEAEPIGV
jgi:hypothetical protein